MLIQEIQDKIIIAMKAKDSEKVLTLKTIKGECDRVSKEPSDTQVLAIIKKMKKGLLLTKYSQSELDLLDSFLPVPYTEEELEGKIRTLTSEYPYKEMGFYMKKIKELGERCDMKLASGILRNIL